ncbi:ABC transporter ATP-binding protein [Nocardioides zeae]|uniref:Iron complex transport system ATP-binding protein n=1 Tax=Nocardioides zeae TaxID=1457234 RepID=A0AAJ1TYT6_9ACTN|nr:ABC transporter ATP-binding protein [Nocardioides zeae]MDQ1104710.1 iron complex transport system ATP-binding protein [Nocardioides zeae]
MNAPVLAARGIACGRGRRPVLTDVHLPVRRGGSLALVGPNGAGKSTLLRVLAGLDVPHAGVVELDGRPLRAVPARERARRLAVVAQHELPPADLQVRELVALRRLPHRSPWRSDDGDGHADAALERLGLGHLAGRAVDHLSGGELRRVLVARALAQEADVLLLDEPTNHLDLRHQHELLAAVRDLGVTVVAAIHDLDLAGRYFDDVAVVDAGTVSAPAPAADVLTPALLADVFGVAAVRLQHPVTGRWHLVVDPQESPR